MRGHTVSGASDGLQAVASAEKQLFDVILLDQEMPRMSGIEAARAIRQKEASSGKKRVRIIGLTGNSTPEDERRSREAGMDGFLAKPFEKSQLFHLVESAGSIGELRGSAGAIVMAATNDMEENAVQDVATHLRRMTSGNDRLIKSLIASFLADAPKKFTEIKRAMENKDAEKLARAAHSLKGSLGIFGVQHPIAAARSLEVMGRTGRLRSAASDLHALEEGLKHLKLELQALQKKTASGTHSRRARRKH